jgi:DNA-directed RNA polymerase beta subunit
MQIRNFGKAQTVLEIPDLVELQTRSYAEFLQALVPFNERKDVGLEAIIREIFPIKSYSGAMALEYIGYELGRPRYTPDECRKLRLTYGAPFKIRVRLDKEEPVEEEVYLGEIPIMLGGGEFIINGAERVIVTQLHRSPGVDFSVEVHAGERKLHSCWIIPERGSWIEVNVGKRDNLTVRIDQSGKFPCATLIRALDEKYTSDEAILKEFYATKEVKKSSRRFRKDITGKVPILELGARRPDQHARGSSAQDLLASASGQPAAARQGEAAVPREVLRRRTATASGASGDSASTASSGWASPRRDDAPSRGLPPQRQVHPRTCATATGEIDDIDHLGNRRVRTLDELAVEELPQGLPEAPAHRPGAHERQGPRRSSQDRRT